MEPTHDLCPIPDFGISGTEPSGYTTRESLTSIFILRLVIVYMMQLSSCLICSYLHIRLLNTHVASHSVVYFYHTGFKPPNYRTAGQTLTMGFNGSMVHYCDTWSAGLRVSHATRPIKINWLLYK
jgi:hypothetical protein